MFFWLLCSPGKGESILDSVVHVKGNVMFPNNSDVAADHYHRYEEDLALAKKMKVSETGSPFLRNATARSKECE